MKFLKKDSESKQERNKEIYLQKKRIKRENTGKTDT